MKDVRNNLTIISLGILGWPIGAIFGWLVAQAMSQIAERLTANNVVNLGFLVFIPLLVWALIRLQRYTNVEAATRSLYRNRMIMLISQFLIALLVVLEFYLASAIGISFGSFMEDSFESLSFLGNFVFQAGDILGVLTPILAVLVGGAIFNSLFSHVGRVISEGKDRRALRIINLVVGALAGSLFLYISGLAINWTYVINNPVQNLWNLSAFGAAIGILLGIFTDPKLPLPIGTSIYFVTRVILNTMRSIEPVIWGIVAVIWVGIGAFAGVLALSVHTIAALGKLYSEQVEGISTGPIEAVTATGANRLQTIIYAVVPQIIPPYISFTMYRWDINVRMSTIIGIIGGGGIGTLLIQNINLLRFRDASVQMLAIAIVVASMDYISSTLRERFV